MAELDDRFERHCIQAIRSAAAELRTEPSQLARLLQDGEIARLAILLNAALPHVQHDALRHRIEDLLSHVSAGRMPMSAEPESELDWALRSLRRRKTDQEHAGPEDAERPPER